MVPIGHPGAPHNMHGPPHSMPSMPSAPSGPNTLSTNQSNKAASSVVSSLKMHLITQNQSIMVRNFNVCHFF